ncbi:DUF3515 family protein [Microbacterium invictum]|uniref:Lipoprotein n=1 Tax=Microbacterium invictum TaxID=515415 RepID=A0AA40VM37_9MICO|nr:DUF3515 family protein [Microbacterium invictum]MBB4138918.1 hypothetical protein [Microbacterium invictum]
MSRPRIALLALTVAGASVLTGCSSTVSMVPGDDANNPLCAELMVRLPDTLSGEDRRWTDAQSTASWGTPSRILFTCGGDEPGPTTLRCEEVDGVDWVIDESEAPHFRVTTYGRSPAVELYLDTSTDGGTGVSSRTVLDVISPIVRQFIEPGRTCVPRTEATPVPEPVEP